MSAPASRLKARPPALVKPGKIKAVLFGVSGVGKTTLALSFPSPYYFDTEGGARGKQYRDLLTASGGAYMGPEDGTLTFETLIEQVKALTAEQHGYKTLIVDSITKLFQTAIANEQEKLGTKDAFGASKKPAVAAMRRLLVACDKLDMNIFFICHETAEWGLVGGERAESGRAPDCWDKLIYELDLTVQAIRQGPARVALVKKTRLVGFPDGERFPLDYAEFSKRHGKDCVEAASEPVTPASADTCAELRKLCGLLGFTPEQVASALTKRNAETFEDLSAAAAEPMLADLRKRAAPILAAQKAEAPDLS